MSQPDSTVSEPDAYHWDAQWNRDQRQHAALLARERVESDRKTVEAFHESFNRAVRQLTDSVSWYATVESLRARDDAEEASRVTA